MQGSVSKELAKADTRQQTRGFQTQVCPQRVVGATHQDLQDEADAGGEKTEVQGTKRKVDEGEKGVGDLEPAVERWRQKAYTGNT